MYENQGEPEGDYRVHFRNLEEFKSNPSWRIKQIKDRVLVWDYGKAVMKYNSRSGCNAVVDGIDQPEPPLFMRMFICLMPLKYGFLRGCRPIIGVDGCHLKGAYQGQILAVVSKDGNNNIYPIAWATVEIENRKTWEWFLESLMQKIGSAGGFGFTFMSDRQKVNRLVEALAAIVPKAETRFYVRHIWANFKLRFTSSVFKELFWSAARVTTYVFIRDARDKPILTQMEWMRRYMMKRNNEKWEDSKLITSNLTPYIGKLFQRMSYVSRNCIVQAARDATYEVRLKDDQVLVDLGNGTCSYYHWQLTGIPCVHACMQDQRYDVGQYVHPYYSMNNYRRAYEPIIQPMSGPKHWERVKMREPQPPAFKVQPGRPKLKKRKLEHRKGTFADGNNRAKIGRSV
ncbi:uncharacterized protein LOC110697683 [Chenopodium quinoa]|uniref:uncharacterized protein LOC110697683 n=1 Tax=Chenopodium quinoa TaxID=63459 RepID=UPI000B77FB12|nr:uncharacterized protein LOC110697683 [Chenopodium quinoa]